MIKNTFVFIIIFVFVGIAVWFFIDKAKTVSEDADLVDVALDQSPTPTPSIMTVDNNKENWIILSNGLKILDVQIGYGSEAKAGDAVTAHYIGTLENGSKFDSSYDRGQPFSFVLGGGMVIKGWDIGIAGMKVGGKRKLIIPPDLAYGDREVGGGIIPANSTLLFEVELVGAETPKQ